MDEQRRWRPFRLDQMSDQESCAFTIRMFRIDELTFSTLSLRSTPDLLK